MRFHHRDVRLAVTLVGCVMTVVLASALVSRYGDSQPFVYVLMFGAPLVLWPLSSWLVNRAVEKPDLDNATEISAPTELLTAMFFVAACLVVPGAGSWYLSEVGRPTEATVEAVRCAAGEGQDCRAEYRVYTLDEQRDLGWVGCFGQTPRRQVGDRLSVTVDPVGWADPQLASCPHTRTLTVAAQIAAGSTAALAGLLVVRYAMLRRRTMLRD